MERNGLDKLLFIFIAFACVCFVSCISGLESLIPDKGMKEVDVSFERVVSRDDSVCYGGVMDCDSYLMEFYPFEMNEHSMERSVSSCYGQWDLKIDNQVVLSGVYQNDILSCDSVSLFSEDNERMGAFNVKEEGSLSLKSSYMRGFKVMLS